MNVLSMLVPNLNISFGKEEDLPRHGSFFSKNSSNATHPPPTRTITVLRKIRTKRSFWLSPNCEQNNYLL